MRTRNRPNMVLPCLACAPARRSRGGWAALHGPRTCGAGAAAALLDFQSLDGRAWPSILTRPFRASNQRGSDQPFSALASSLPSRISTYASLFSSPNAPGLVSRRGLTTLAPAHATCMGGKCGPSCLLLRKYLPVSFLRGPTPKTRHILDLHEHG